ncbi:Predicted RNA-binding protein, contains TRAM domain [Halopenitus malekzadehii]|uniref:Predicted RNA-binding protein, contains TRAM domain n=1 Tax=Halopenitus malekzadehii TaxID=1267564 RepID=A0A1H6JR44_9EURY|nr:TRAM domain-containing protein [Halopenitus malekzadehii]SEH61775.1 Predicted RNA-binding protein, contains TRAM domain [Halopenitus malekzadehii]
MADCPLADDCPSFEERIQGMGCQHYGNRGGAEWCQHYDMPIHELKRQPVQPGEEVVVEVDDIHESGAGVGRTDDGFIILVDGVLPPARAKVRIHRVQSNHATAKEVVERLPDDPDEADGDPDEADGDPDEADGGSVDDEEDDRSRNQDPARERLGSRENFWGR